MTHPRSGEQILSLAGRFADSGSRHDDVPGGFIRRVVGGVAEGAKPSELDQPHHQHDQQGQCESKLDDRRAKSSLALSTRSRAH
ncbi:MAG TPA: hypothetical protein PJ982_01830 [Lacipirellulaceae bacterium]|nr:hypothetical protein [Lacipirellulaceae bacterium]